MVIKVLNDDPYDLKVKISIDNLKLGLMNGLRRIMIGEIPTYAFVPSDVKIDKNTSYYYNNTRLKSNSFGLLPLINLPKDIKSDDELTASLMVTNINKQVTEYTTDDCQFFVNGTSFKMKYDPPITLIKLRTDEEIRLTATASIGIHYDHARWSAVTVVEYDYEGDKEKPTSVTYGIESREQFKSKDIFLKACDVLIEKVQIFIQNVDDKMTDKQRHFQDVYLGESYSLCNFLKDYLFEHLDFIAVTVPNQSNKEFFIYCRKNKDLKKTIIKQLKKSIEFIEDLKKSFNKTVK